MGRSPPLPPHRRCRSGARPPPLTLYTRTCAEPPSSPSHPSKTMVDHSADRLRPPRLGPDRDRRSNSGENRPRSPRPPLRHPLRPTQSPLDRCLLPRPPEPPPLLPRLPPHPPRRPPVRPRPPWPPRRLQTLASHHYPHRRDPRRRLRRSRQLHGQSVPHLRPGPGPRRPKPPHVAAPPGLERTLPPLRRRQRRSLEGSPPH